MANLLDFPTRTSLELLRCVNSGSIYGVRRGILGIAEGKNTVSQLRVYVFVSQVCMYTA